LQQSVYISDKDVLQLFAHHEHTELFTKKHAVTFDLRQAYWQLPAFGCFFYQTDDGQILKVNKLLFGLDVAAELASITTNIVRGHPSFVREPFVFRDDDAVIYTHIDNIALTTNDKAVAERFEHSVMTAAKALSVTLNDSDGVVAAFTFCGVSYDLTNSTYKLSSAFVSKLRNKLLTAADGAAVADFESVFGSLVYASAVLQLGLHAYWLVIKWWRRRLAAAYRPRFTRDGDERRRAVRLPPSVRIGFDALAAKVLANDPVRRSPSTGQPIKFSPVLYTDSSLQGAGAVLFIRGREPVVVGLRWPTDIAHTLVSGDIAVLETAAVLFGLRKFGAALAGQHVLVLVDNTTVAARKVRDLSVDMLLAACDRTAATFNMMVTVGWVPTKANVADWPSRGVAPSGRAIIASRALAEEMIATAAPAASAPKLAAGRRLAVGCWRRAPVVTSLTHP